MTYISPLDGMTFDEPRGDAGDRLLEHYADAHEGKSRAELLGRRADCIARSAELKGYGRLSQAQAREADDLIAEQIILDDLVTKSDVEIRRSKIEDGKAAMSNRANREDPGGAAGAPALVHGLGDRLETPAESIQRMRSDPWRDGDGAPLASRIDSAAGLVSRCHTALEGMEERLTRDGAQMLGNLLSERPSIYGPYEIRTAEDIRRSAAWVLALSDPRYATAFEKILRQPEVFRSGAGVLMWDDGERQAYSDVISRAAMIENTGTGGQYWLPLYLDPTIVLTNAGAASPWRSHCRVVQTVSNTWNGVASAGVTAGWLAEGATASDNSPTITQLAIPVFKEAAWVMTSYELEGDQPNVAASIPMLISDARERLEEAAFVTGTASGQPAGTITRATVDGNTGLLTVANAVAQFSLLAGLPVRFRVGDQARPFWAANILVINAMRALTAFSAATASIVNDNTEDGIPEVFGIDLLESTTMDGVLTTGGHKGLLLMDGNSYLIVDRIGTQMIYEPLVASAGGILPSGVAGWFAWARVGADVSAATGLRVHSTT